jgi:excinuclease UvrABC ATPase subunit
MITSETVAVGPSKDVAREPRSYTGHYLKGVLKRGRKEAAE